LEEGDWEGEGDVLDEGGGVVVLGNEVSNYVTSQGGVQDFVVYANNRCGEDGELKPGEGEREGGREGGLVSTNGFC
jgi:hypothetical protein